MYGYSIDNWNSSNDYLMFESVLSGQAWTQTTNACQLQYQPVTNTAYLLNDNLYSWSSGAVGSSTILSNSNCSINLAFSYASHPGNGTGLTLAFSATFSATYAGPKDLWVASFVNSWTAYYEGTFAIESLVPFSGTYSAGQAVTFTMYGESADNWSSASDYLMFESVLSGQGWGATTTACQFQYEPVTNTAYLLNDNLSTWSSGALGSSATLANSKCSVNLAASSANHPGAGAGIVVVFPVTFSAGYAGTKDLFVAQFVGTWTAFYEGSIQIGAFSQLGAPTFTPGAGTYTSFQFVTINKPDPGATIRYTTDGITQPSETIGTIYSGPVTISSSSTLKAIAYENGWNDSSIASARYTITLNASWFNTSWTYRKPVTIDHTKVAGGSSLTNFPVLFSITDPDLKSIGAGGQVGEFTGNDILFTAADGVTKLNHELELYNPATGTVIAWVQMPTLSSTANTVIYIYYGNSYAQNQQNGGGVWDANYMGVWHLPNGTTLTANDSSYNANNGTVNSVAATSGQVDGAGMFNGSYSSISVNKQGTTLDASHSFTASAWVYLTDNSNEHFILEKRDGCNDPNYWLSIWSDGTAMVGFYDTTYEAVTSQNSVPLNAWHYLSGTYNQPGATMGIYIDGAQVGSASASGLPTVTGNDQMLIGRSTCQPRFLSGDIDEVRVSNIARSAGWIQTEYNNQASPSGFYGIGTQQLAPVSTPTFSPVSGVYSSAQNVTISTTTGATIRYTTDGATSPSETVGTVYSGPIAINSSTTLMAIAYESGLADSSVASAPYTIRSTVSAPSFNPAGGAYNSPQSITISTTPSGATVRYTTDGVTDPSESVGTIYGGPIVINSSVTLKAIGYASGWSDSTVSSASYTIANTVAAPTFNPASGAISAGQTVSIATTPADATIRYTLDGSDPSHTNGAVYSGPIGITGTMTLKAIAYKAGWLDSTITLAQFTVAPREYIYLGPRVIATEH